MVLCPLQVGCTHWTWSPTDFHWRKRPHWIHLSIQLSSQSSDTLHLQKGWQSTPLRRLPWSQQDYQEGSLPTSLDLRPLGYTMESPTLYKNWSSTCLPPCLHCGWWQMEDYIPHSLRLVWMASNALWTFQCACCFPTIHEWNLHRYARCLCYCLPRWYPHLLWRYVSTQSSHQGSTSETPQEQPLH